MADRFYSPTLQINDAFYGRPPSQKNEIAKKGKNVVMTSKTHYFASLLLLLPYLEELKKSSSAGGKSGTFKKFCSFMHSAYIFGVLRLGENLARSTH